MCIYIYNTNNNYNNYHHHHSIILYIYIHIDACIYIYMLHSGGTHRGSLGPPTGGQRDAALEIASKETTQGKAPLV